MSRYRWCVVVATAALMAGFAAIPLHAQQWSAEQQDVWKSVEAYWSLHAKGDVQGLIGYFDSNYIGWSYDSPMPMDKEAVHKFIAYESANSQVEVYDLTPVAIKVHGDFAIVDYYFIVISKDGGGSTRHSKGRWTDILAKRGDRWVLIGDHGGEMNDD